MSKLKKQKVALVKFADIETPKTVEEFRANLKRFFMSFGDDCLYVRCPINGTFGVPFEEIESLDDLYSKTGLPMITPFVDYSNANLKRFMKSKGTPFSAWGFFADEKTNVRIWDSEKLSRSDLFDLPLKWFQIDNQILREFYVKVLGDFSGYRGFKSVEAA